MVFKIATDLDFLKLYFLLKIALDLDFLNNYIFIFLIHMKIFQAVTRENTFFKIPH